MSGAFPDLGVDRPRAAVVAIDCHRGHLDPAVATMPAAPDVAARLVEANRRFLDGARALGIPVAHCVATYRDAGEIAANPFWRTRARAPNATRRNVLRHNIAGMPGCEIMPGLLWPSDIVVATKKRYDCFVATDLDFALRARGVDTLLITGINTNSCVLATATAANVRDYAVVVVRDCVDTMDSRAHHDAALLCLSTAFAHVMDSAEVLEMAAGWPRRAMEENSA
ncbi:MAG: cysteine hydrolase [Acetobacteraceae bacterium]|nr:cysteine hydrolase [Acetobacteraceae bacterium]